MVALPQPTLDAVYAAYEKRNEERHSRRIGASQIGRQCDRRLWYSFRHAGREKFNGRMLRLFQTGHREEARIIDDLRAAGIEVWDRDPQTGQQFEYTALDGHLVVKLDGVALGILEAPDTPHVLEVKTHNRKSFDKLVAEGVEKSKPDHFAQCQIGMGLADLTRAVYVAHCKDTDDLYLERFHYDDKVFKALLLRAKRIIDAEEAPAKISKDPAYYVCKFCPFAELCHGEALPEVNCRTCVHSTPAGNGEWACGVDKKMEPGCGEHVFAPSMLESWAEPVDGDPTFIKYRIRRNGRLFINVAASGFPADDAPHYDSRELANCQVAAIGDPAVEAARTILDGKVVKL